jgi:hypothetical protein
MEFPDLSPYSYYQPKPFRDVLNVGWLGRGQVFPVGNVPSEFVEKLKLLMSDRRFAALAVNRIRSVHPCNVCGEREFSALGDAAGGIPIGSAELWVPRSSGGFFAAPSMIIHYITDHRYLPPKLFVNSVVDVGWDDVVDAQSEYAKRASLAMN